jgi:hypothetical protein
MNQWVESKDGKWHWYQQFSKDEMELLKKYHTQISRMTKLDFSRIIKD